MQDILDIINKSRNILNWKEIRFNYFDFIFCHHIYLEIIAVINYVFFLFKNNKNVPFTYGKPISTFVHSWKTD